MTQAGYFTALCAALCGLFIGIGLPVFLVAVAGFATGLWASELYRETTKEGSRK